MAPDDYSKTYHHTSLHHRASSYTHVLTFTTATTEENRHLQNLSLSSVDLLMFGKI